MHDTNPPRSGRAIVPIPDDGCTCEKDEYGHMPHCEAPVRQFLKEARDDLDRIRRLFNRLEAAVSHHKRANAGMLGTTIEADEALYKARDKILSDYAEGKG